MTKPDRPAAHRVRLSQLAANSGEAASAGWMTSAAGCSTTAKTRPAMNRAVRTTVPPRVSSDTSTRPRPVRTSTRRPARVATTSYMREAPPVSMRISTLSPFTVITTSFASPIIRRFCRRGDAESDSPNLVVLTDRRPGEATDQFRLAILSPLLAVGPPAAAHKLGRERCHMGNFNSAVLNQWGELDMTRTTTGRGRPRGCKMPLWRNPGGCEAPDSARPAHTGCALGGHVRWNRPVRQARPQRPVLITSAERSRREEIRHRETRYVTAMMVRVVFIIVAVVALHSWARFLGMIAAICIPWLAVLYANAGPIRSRKREPSLYRRDTSALPDDPYPLGDGGQTIVEGEWTGPHSRRERSAEPAALPPALSGRRSEHQRARRRS